MKIVASIRTMIAVASIALCGNGDALAGDRTFEFHYSFTITDLEPGTSARVWIPQAASDPAQEVTIVDSHLPPTVVTNTDASGLNKMFYAVAQAGSDGAIPLSVTYHVVRHEIRSLPIRDAENIDADLKPDRLVPIGGKPGQLLASKTLPTDDAPKARALFDLVFDYMTYSKDKPGWGRGDVNWACDSRQGNCSDFHSLFLSLCRTTNVPAKMEFGFIIPGADRPPTVANYHCWAYFKPSTSGAWVPVDISKAKNRPAQKEDFFGRLDADRMGFSTGRDIRLTPPQAGPALNYFIYPYVEVDGQPLAAEKIQRTFNIAASSSTQPSTQPSTPPATQPATQP